MNIKADERGEDLSPPDNFIEDILVLQSDACYDLDLQVVLHSAADDVRSGLPGRFLIIQETCRLNGLEWPTHAPDIVRAAHWGLSRFLEHLEASELLSEAWPSVEEPEVEFSRLLEANSVSPLSKNTVAGLEE